MSVCLSAPVKAKMFKTFFSAFSAKEGSFKARKGLARDLTWARLYQCSLVEVQKLLPAPTQFRKCTAA